MKSEKANHHKEHLAISARAIKEKLIDLLGITELDSGTGLNQATAIKDKLDHCFSTGGPQLGIVMHKWATGCKSSGPWTSVYFENGLAYRTRLRNTGPYEQPYGPAPAK